MHDELAKQMSATKFSSALTVYNDKKMKEEYDEYTKKIKAQEEKLNSCMDKWYAKFSAMETALAKLESKTTRSPVCLAADLFRKNGRLDQGGEWLCRHAIPLQNIHRIRL